MVLCRHERYTVVVWSIVRKVIMPTIATLLPLWRASLQAANKSERTIVSYLAAMQALLDELPPGCELVALTPRALRRYQSRLAVGRAARTTALHLTGIRSFCRWCVVSELLASDPTAGLDYPALGRRLPGRALTACQVRQLFAAFAAPCASNEYELWHWQRNRRLCALMVYTGLRIGEAVRLTWFDVDQAAGVLVVRGGKGNKDRAIPLHAALRFDLINVRSKHLLDPVVGQYSGRQLTVKSADHIFSRWIPNNLDLAFSFHSHQLRHTFCTALIRNQVSLFDVQRLMGHADPKTTQGYYDLAADDLRAAIERLPQW